MKESKGEKCYDRFDRVGFQSTFLVLIHSSYKLFYNPLGLMSCLAFNNKPLALIYAQSSS